MADQTILLAYHLKEAQKAGLNSRAFKPAPKVLIEAITKLYPKPINPAPELASSSRKTRSKKSKEAIQAEYNTPFPEQWAIDGSLITKSVTQLSKSTYAFQDSLAFKAATDPNSTPSVGGTPELSSEPSPSHTPIGSPSDSPLALPLRIDSPLEVPEQEPIVEKSSVVESAGTKKDTPEILAIIEDGQGSLKESVSAPQSIVTAQRPGIDPILPGAFPWQEPTSSYPLLDLFRKETNSEPSPIPESSGVVLVPTPPVAGLNQPLGLAAATSFRPAYSPTTPRISALRGNPQVRFTSPPVNLFDFLNTVVPPSSASSISSRSVSSSHLPLRNFPRSPTIPLNEESESESAEKELPLRPKTPLIDSSPEGPDSPSWQEESTQEGSEEIGEVEPNLDPSKPRIQELRDSQSLSPSPEHHFSSNASQSSSETPMEAGGQGGPGGPGGSDGQGGTGGNNPPPGPNLSQQDIQGIALSMFNLFRDNIAPRDGNVPNNNSSNDDWKGSFRAQDVGFFDPTLDESYGPGDVVQVGRDVYYRNVYLFVERIKDAVNMYTADKVRSNLSSCLRGTAQIWYTEGLSDLEKEALRSLGTGAEKWCDALTKKFKQSVSSALQSLSSESYSLDDLRNKRDMSSFVFSVMRHAKAANIADVHGQLTWAYNAIAPELARDIDPPEETTSVSTFLKQLDNKRETWFRIYSRKFNKGSSGYGYQSFSKYQNSNPYSKYDRRDDKEAYKSNQEQPQIVGRQERLLLAPPSEKPNGDSQTADRPSDDKGNPSGQKNTQSADPPWSRQPLKDYNSGGRGGYRSGYTPNKYGRRGRGNFYRSDRWQDNRYGDREQYQEAYAGEERPDEEGPSEPYEDIDPNEEFDGEDAAEPYSYNLHPESPGICKKCGKPREEFSSNNVFHNHIRSCSGEKPLVEVIQEEIPNLPVIRSSAPSAVGNGLGFRSYQYATVWLRVGMKPQVEAVADTGCPMSLIDEDYLRNILPNLIISKMPAPVNVRGIGNALHECTTYAMLDIFLDGSSQTAPARGHIHREFHVVKNLKCKILLGMDILGAEQMNIDLANKVMVIPTCKDLVVSIRIAPKPNARIRRVVHSKEEITIPAKSVAKVPTYLKGKKLPDNRDYLFEPNQAELTAAFGRVGGFYTHICDCNISFVQVKNDLPIPVALPKRARLGTLTEYEEEGCYQVEAEYHEAAIVINVKEHYAWLGEADQKAQDFHRVTCETQNRQHL